LALVERNGYGQPALSTTFLLDNFRLAQFHFFLKASSDISLPIYKGSTLRGGFGSKRYGIRIEKGKIVIE
jgi:hypothetical protein